MPLYQIYMVDTNAFEEYFSNPSDSQLHSFVEALGTHPQANDWFTEYPPVWKEDPLGWVRERFNIDDWYGDLTEPEMIAWEHASQKVLNLEEVELKTNFKGLPIDGISTSLFAFAAEALDQKGTESSFLRLRPYRFHNLPKRIAKRKRRIYWHQHAVVLPHDVSEMLKLFKDYDLLVDGLVPRDSQLSHLFDVEGEIVCQEVSYLMKLLRKLKKENATWYAPIDC